MATVEILHLSVDVHANSLPGAIEKGIKQGMCKYLAADKPPGYSKFMKDHNTCIIASLFIFSETYLLSKCHHCLISSFFTGPFLIGDLVFLTCL